MYIQNVIVIFFTHFEILRGRFEMFYSFYSAFYNQYRCFYTASHLHKEQTEPFMTGEINSLAITEDP